jgi:hypothetical protein
MKPSLDWEVDGMKIRPYDHPLRFLVSSQSEGETKQYVVQLDAFWYTGQCTCEDFTYRHQPILVREEHNDEESLRCKHLKAVRQKFCSHMIRLLAEQEGKKNSRV